MHHRPGPPRLRRPASLHPIHAARPLAFVLVVGLAAAVLASVPLATPAAAASTMTCPGTPAPVGPGATGTPTDGFHALTPTRLVDTRNGRGGVDQRPDRNCILRIGVADVVGATATAIALSVLAVDADDRGFLTAYPCGSARPPTSNVNPRPDTPTPNLAIVPLDATRAVCVFTNVATNIVVDATGWFGPGGARFNERAPQRVLDTRDEFVPLGAGTVRRLPLRGAVLPTSATAVTVNITVSNPDDDGWALAYPCTDDLPLASTVNYLAGEDRAGLTTVGLAGNGDLCLYSLRSTQIIVDLVGWYGTTGESSVQPLVGKRLADSRNGIGGWNGKLAAGETRVLSPLATGALPAHTYALSLNIIATEADTAGHLRVYPCDQARPNVSAVNFVPDDEATNMVMASLSDESTICVFASAPTHVVVDVFGAVAAPGLVRALSVANFGPFATERTDYAAACLDPVDVDVRGVPGATVRIDGAKVDTTTSTTVKLFEDEATRVEVDLGSETAEYWWRCIPADFSTYSVSVADDPVPGWYLMSFGFSFPGAPAFVTILDQYGTPVWYKRTASTTIDLKLLADDTLAWTPLLGTAYGKQPDGTYEIHELDGSLVRTVGTVDDPTDHHELLLLNNGNYLAVTYPQRMGVDLTALGLGPNRTVLDSHLQELTPAGDVVWTWKSEDHFAVDETTDPVAFPLGVDLLHINSVDEYADGDLLVSARHLDSVFRINRADGEIEWKLGGSGTNPDGATQLAISGDPYNGTVHAHDARIVDADTITALDNRSGNTAGQPARAVEYDINAGAGTAKLVWEQRNPTGKLSGGLGSARRTPEGTTVVNWGSVPNQSRIVQEFDAAGNVVFALDYNGQMYRVEKVPFDAFDIDELRAHAGGAAEPKP